MDWSDKSVEEKSTAQALSELADLWERIMSTFGMLAELAEHLSAKLEPCMTTTMHRTTHSHGERLSLAAARLATRHATRHAMRRHTAATGQ